ncbi:MAG: hypothetical protein QXS45_04025, partial [Sulfolobales archaeon]
LSPTNPHLVHCSILLILLLLSFDLPPHLGQADDVFLKVNEFYFVKYSVIKYRNNNITLYPLGRDKKKIEYLHGKQVYIIIIEEE